MNAACVEPLAVQYACPAIRPRMVGRCDGAACQWRRPPVQSTSPVNQSSQPASPGARAPLLASPAAISGPGRKVATAKSSTISRPRCLAPPSSAVRALPPAQWVPPSGAAVDDGWPDDPLAPAPLNLPNIPAQELMPGTTQILGVSWKAIGWGTDSPIAIPILAAVGLIPCAVRQRQPCLRLVGFDPSVSAPSG
jgi:hypothetical protein